MEVQEELIFTLFSKYNQAPYRFPLQKCDKAVTINGIFGPDNVTKICFNWTNRRGRPRVQLWLLLVWIQCPCLCLFY